MLTTWKHFKNSNQVHNSGEPSSIPHQILLAAFYLIICIVT